MNKFAFRLFSTGIVGSIVVVGSVWGTKAANIETEVPLAGITVTLDKYYEETLSKSIGSNTITPFSLNSTEDYLEGMFNDSEITPLDKSEDMELTGGESEELSEELIQEQLDAIETTENNSAEETESSEYDDIGIANVSNYLNIRDKGSESGKIIGKLTKNAGCRIISIEDGWARIKSGKVSGYVNADYLITGAEAEKLAQEVGSKVAIVTGTGVRVRREPSTDAKISMLIPVGEEVEVVEEYDEWVKVLVDRDEGYIFKELVKVSYELKKAVAVVELQANSSTGVSSLRANVVSYAKQFLGNRYVWGGTSLTNGTDCSGFTQGVLRHFGYSISRVSRDQARNGTAIKASEAKPGDLIFYGSGSYINHVAMYIGNGQVIHASNAKTGIKISNLYYRTPIKAVRIIRD